LFERYDLIRFASGKHFPLAAGPLHLDPLVVDFIRQAEMHTRIVLRRKLVPL